MAGRRLLAAFWQMTNGRFPLVAGRFLAAGCLLVAERQQTACPWPVALRWQLASAKLLAADRWQATLPCPPPDTLKLVSRSPLMTGQLISCSKVVAGQ